MNSPSLERELLAPLIPRAAPGRPRVSDGRVVNGMVCKIRTGISWRDPAERYDPWKTVYTRFRRYALEGVFTRALQQMHARADAAGDIDWLTQKTPPSSAPTSTPPPPAEKRDPSAGRTGRSRPRPVPRRTDHQAPSRLATAAAGRWLSCSPPPPSASARRPATPPSKS
ncbi:transposase [Streptomyces sp. PRKS01-65]|nr:transposase [Streptomyces harenosi]